MGSLLRPAGAAFVSLAFLATVCEAAPPAQGRWEGEIQIPGAPMVLILDLAKDSATPEEVDRDAIDYSKASRGE